MKYSHNKVDYLARLRLDTCFLHHLLLMSHPNHGVALSQNWHALVWIFPAKERHSKLIVLAAHKPPHTGLEHFLSEAGTEHFILDTNAGQ